MTVSYFEWVQNLQSLNWKEQEVNDKLFDVMTKAFSEVWTLAQERGVSMRLAAYMVALKRLVTVKKHRPIFP